MPAGIILIKGYWRLPSMKVYVVDNGGQWTHREWRVLKYLKVETKIVPNTTPFDELKDLDGLVLSGGAPSVACDSNRMGNNDEYLDKATFPVLGICAGMSALRSVLPMCRSSGRSGSRCPTTRTSSRVCPMISSCGGLTTTRSRPFPKDSG